MECGGGKLADLRRAGKKQGCLKTDYPFSGSRAVLAKRFYSAICVA
uniref:Uncharacterized protein n=1 Tax=Conchiformibius kuhniae TaxID=211502 RepID=A0A8T9MXF1_9NEIS|nr:hypothetical protein LVJ77_02310 [Conchiformibius kuhniae]